MTGRSIPRIDGRDRVTGTALYAGDWRVPNMLYGKIVMSSIPHGSVTNFDLDEARSTPGVEAIITCKDMKVAWAAGERTSKERRVLVERVRFLGDIVAAVAATSREAAQEAATKIHVEYDELSSLIDPTKAAEATAPRIWDEGNVQEKVRYTRGDVGIGFKEADSIFEDEYITHRHQLCPLERATSLAWWEMDKLTLVASTQGITKCKAQMAADLGLPANKVRVICKYKGGGFGNKNNNMNYDLIAAILSKKTNKPVMLEYSRRDEFVGLHGRWGTTQRYRVGVKRDGTLTALSLKATCDVGAYARPSTPFEYVVGAKEIYNCKNVETEILPVYTNTSATGNQRFPAGVPGCFGVESFLDQVANDIGINPLDFHLKNRSVLANCELPYTSYGLEECILKGAETIKWNDRWHKPDGRPTIDGSKKHGIGMAMCTKHVLAGRGSAIAKINSDGSAEVAVSVTDIGTGAKSTMAIMAAEELGVPVESVNVVWGDTDSCPFSIGESASRTTTLTGAAVVEAARDAKNRLLRRVSERMQIPHKSLEIRDGFIIDRARVKNVASLKEAVADSDGFSIVGHATASIEPPANVSVMSFAAHFAEVLVDTETGHVDVTRYVAAHDSGKVVNRLTAESQVQGGVAMGLSLALFEELLIDADIGAVANPSFLTYRILTQSSMPKVEALLIETDDPYGPKNLGEIPVAPVAPAVCNAIFNATGARVKEMPMTPERILNAVDARGPRA